MFSWPVEVGGSAAGTAQVAAQRTGRRQLIGKWRTALRLVAMEDNRFVGVAIKPGVAGRIKWSGGATSRPIRADVNVPTAAVAVALPLP